RGSDRGRSGGGGALGPLARGRAHPRGARPAWVPRGVAVAGRGAGGGWLGPLRRPLRGGGGGGHRGIPALGGGGAGGGGSRRPPRERPPHPPLAADRRLGTERSPLAALVGAVIGLLYRAPAP